MPDARLRTLLPAVLVLCALVPTVRADEPTVEDLERRNAQLEREVARLRARVAELEKRLVRDALGETSFLVSTREGVVRVTPEGEVEPVRSPDGRALRGMLSRSGDDVFCRDYRTVRRLNRTGTVMSTVTLDERVVGHGYVALPGRRFAVFDNEGDRIFLVDRAGRPTQELAMRAEPDRSMQSTFGLVVGTRLLVSEDGDKRILAVDLESHAVDVFRDLGTLRSWIGAIANDGDTYYVCTGTEVYALEGDEPRRLVAKLPKGNITGLLVLGSQAFVTVNFTGELLRIDLETGDVATVVDGLVYPESLVVLPN